MATRGPLAPLAGPTPLRNASAPCTWLSYTPHRLSYTPHTVHMAQLHATHRLSYTPHTLHVAQLYARHRLSYTPHAVHMAQLHATHRAHGSATGRGVPRRCDGSRQVDRTNSSL